MKQFLTVLFVVALVSPVMGQAAAVYPIIHDASMVDGPTGRNNWIVSGTASWAVDSDNDQVLIQWQVRLKKNDGSNDWEWFNIGDSSIEDEVDFECPFQVAVPKDGYELFHDPAEPLIFRGLWFTWDETLSAWRWWQPAHSVLVFYQIQTRGLTHRQQLEWRFDRQMMLQNMKEEKKRKKK